MTARPCSLRVPSRPVLSRPGDPSVLPLFPCRPGQPHPGLPMGRGSWDISEFRMGALIPPALGSGELAPLLSSRPYPFLEKPGAFS